MTMTMTRKMALQFTLGDRMKKSLKVAQVSRSEIAQFMKVAEATVSTWMNDGHAPSHQTLMLWAMKTEVDLVWLETGKEEAPIDALSTGASVRPKGFEPPTF
ncbi:helix-turn-helix domain-containing protein [Cryobacterium sp. Y62]|uniref:helix-turn-helix domain-containing protein n=1 Tax=Cryobacterium sp. Y62 TaxID=2048284 RepID=UPI000CE2ED2B|nr:helix-turn-helix domain-containing protein [Cryobacterium sp. Y62]